MKPRKTSRPKPWKEAFLRILNQRPNVVYACQQVDISRETAYTEREKDKDFESAWEAAIKRGIDAIKGVMVDHSLHGVERRVIMKDEHGALVTADTYLEFPYGAAFKLLAAHDPAFRPARNEFDLSAKATMPDGKLAEFSVHVSAEELP